MITLQVFCRKLDELFQVSEFKDYCENGLQVEGKSDLKKLGTAVSASLETIEKAAELGMDALVVHHGLFWQSDSYAVAGAKKKKLETLLKSNISLLAYHLPMDAHPDVGNNWRAARDLGLNNLTPFGEINGVMIGVMGKISPVDRNEFLHHLESYYGHKAHSSLGGREKIQTVALVSGGAYKMLGLAAKKGADCFVTGNFDEPAWYQAQEESINFFALGHAATEKVGPKALADYIRRQMRLECHFVDIPNPF